ncbi:hypothetical protein T484DRAFT_1864740 [Baffinella frigidus]|nr:hypothetical protein T484DRAFT_1864740 [Cryptophyta sp. CCMP2293]
MALTRAFVHFLHHTHIQVVTLADLEMDGSHNMSNNMQPPLQPSSRDKFAKGIQKLTENAKSMLAGDASTPPPPVAAAAGSDVRFPIAVAALKLAVASGAGGALAPDVAAAACLAVSLSQTLPLAERSFPVPPAALDAWTAGAGKWPKAVEDFMVAYHAGIAAASVGKDSLMTASVGKDSPMTVADVVDGRFVLMIIAKSLAGGISPLPPAASGAAQKLFGEVCAGDSRARSPQRATKAQWRA